MNELTSSMQMEIQKISSWISYAQSACSAEWNGVLLVNN
uniref:Uncharacterized protein n=1 Tax=Arundo donax TaxID=35708 RepID=A0A0A8ZSJ2_ARUDO